MGVDVRNRVVRRRLASPSDSLLDLRIRRLPHFHATHEVECHPAQMLILRKNLQMVFGVIVIETFVVIVCFVYAITNKPQKIALMKERRP